MNPFRCIPSCAKITDHEVHGRSRMGHPITICELAVRIRAEYVGYPVDDDDNDDDDELLIR